MKDAVDTVEVGRLAREVEALHGCSGRGRVPLLLGGVVVVVERVDAGDLVAGGGERGGEMRADEARSPGDEIPAHCFGFIP
jgi:hypothetical protein